ncbi:terminase [Nocardioides jensenii]|uniref:terminase n=1 Tax=Nocardioides jensenii TaxID=1843 RepID=UPI0012F782D3|nr:terminase [Nocardioides jensenii]
MAASSRSSRKASRDPAPKRYGSTTPRVFTPPLRPLEPRTPETEQNTLGYSVIDFAEHILKITLLPWQCWLLVHMLELRPDNTLRFRTVVVLVARQNGKSTLSQVLALWMMYVYGLNLVLGTAQDLDTAEEVWQGAVDLVTDVDDETDEPIRPELFDLLDKVVQVNGKKALVLKNRKRYKVKAANRRAGRGLSGDLILLDELREHQSWDAWGSITKTTMARSMALILALSNAGDATSIVLRFLRQKAHAAVGDPDGLNEADELIEADQLEDFTDEAEDLLEDDDSLGLFEWSAKPGRSVRDRDGWVESNPSMGYTITERTLASACATDPEWVFRTECLCQWSEGTLEGPFPPGAWEAGRWVQRAKKDEPPKIVGQVKACIDISHDRTMTYISFAGRRADGLPQAEVVAARAGQHWVAGWLADPKRRHRIEEVTGQSKGAPVSNLMKELKAGVVDADGMPLDLPPIIDWTGDDLAGWTGEVFDLVRAGAVTDDGKQVGVRHLPQPALDLAAATAVFKPLGERFVIDRAKSPTDVAPLVAFFGALALLIRPTPPPETSAYEDNDLLVL